MKDYSGMQRAKKAGGPYIGSSDGYSSRPGEAGNSSPGHSGEKCGLTHLVLKLLSLLHHPLILRPDTWFLTWSVPYLSHYAQHHQNY